MDQERLTSQDMESLGEEILKEKQSLGRELYTLKAEKDRQVFDTLFFEYNRIYVHYPTVGKLQCSSSITHQK